MRCFKNIFILLLCSVTSFCFGQKEDRNWVFGDSIRIDFNNLTGPGVSNSNCYNFEVNSSISDKNGNLLMYMNSVDFMFGDFKYCQILNSQDNIMENGDSIVQSFSATNGAIFLPFPGDSLKYFFLTIGDLSGQQNYKLYYSIIDLSYNSGLGKVISKNNLLADNITEQLLGIRHGNGRDWWLITKKILSNQIIKFLITPNGISNPLSQNIGSEFFRPEGECASSKNGDKISFTCIYGNKDVFDFNRCNGMFSNWIELGTPPYDQPDIQGWDTYGCEFSPDETRIYFSRFNTNLPGANIFQYTMNSSNTINTLTEILPETVGYLLGQLELGPDDKIYSVGAIGPGILDSSYEYLTVINSPNNSGSLCDLQLFSLYLNGQFAFGGLPNMPHYNLTSLDGSACDTLGIDAPNNIEAIQKSILNIYPNPANDELTIEVLNGIAPNQIEITNSLGVTVMQLHQTKPTAQLNIKQLPAGVYFVKVKMQDGSVTVRRFVKL